MNQPRTKTRVHVTVGDPDFGGFTFNLLVPPHQARLAREELTQACHRILERWTRERLPGSQEAAA